MIIFVSMIIIFFYARYKDGVRLTVEDEGLIAYYHPYILKIRLNAVFNPLFF